MTEESKQNAQIENEQQAQPSMFQSIQKSMIGLGLFAVVTAGLIAATQILTAERIEEQINLAKSKALFEIVPANEHNNSMLEEAFKIMAPELGLEEPTEAYLAKDDGNLVALILPIVAPDGYSGKIRLILGINADGSVKGLRVVSHQETPGLGDKIELQKSDWILGFNGRSFKNTSEAQWKVKKDGGTFDQLTGATITPRAIVNATYQALKYYETHQASLSIMAAGQEFSPGLLTHTTEQTEE